MRKVVNLANVAILMANMEDSATDIFGSYGLTETEEIEAKARRILDKPKEYFDNIEPGQSANKGTMQRLVIEGVVEEAESEAEAMMLLVICLEDVTRNVVRHERPVNPILEILEMLP